MVVDCYSRWRVSALITAHAVSQSLPRLVCSLLLLLLLVVLVNSAIIGR